MQTMIVLAIVTAAAGFIAVKAWRALVSARRATKQQGCASCGCDGPTKDPLAM